MTFQEQIQEQLRTDFVPGREYFEKPEVYEQEILKGIFWDKSKYHLPRLDHHAPYKQGQLTTIIGHTNVGKTTLALFLFSRIIDERKLIIYSAENRISQLARLMIQFRHQSKNYQAHFDWLRSRVMFIKHVKQFSYKEMLEQMAISDDIGFNADMIFIDPYNSLKVEKNGSHQYHYEAIEDMRIYCQQTRKSIFLNCHTVTEAQRVKPNASGEIALPLMGDVEGGAKFPNKSDDVWVVHRDLYHVNPIMRRISKLVVGKVRNTEGGGEPTGFSNPIEFDFLPDWTGYRELNSIILPAPSRVTAEALNGQDWKTKQHETDKEPF